MQQEDDIRGLAKTMEFMRAVSILFLVIHVYWYCYQAFSDMGISIGIVDKILLNFQRTAGLFRSLLLTKVFALIFRRPGIEIGERGEDRDPQGRQIVQRRVQVRAVQRPDGNAHPPTCAVQSARL